MVERPRSHNTKSRPARVARSAPFVNLSSRRVMTDRTPSHLVEPLLPSDSTAPPSPAHGSRRLLATVLISFTILTALALIAAPPILANLPRLLKPAPRQMVISGTTIVAACANRHSMLATALPSWLDVVDLSQIVLVDWSSDPPLLPTVKKVLQSTGSQQPSIRVIRVENETDWVLSRAYNLAVRHASYETVFKVDCDCILHPQAVVHHKLNAPKYFYTGYYENARDANEIHLNGALVVSQTNFWSVAGYDERIQTYGFDDEDLYHRLVHNGATRLNVSYELISHIAHEDSRRAQERVKFPRVQIDINRLLLESIAKPWGKASRGSEYEILHGDSNLLCAVYVPQDLERMVGEEEYTRIKMLALGRRLHDDYVIPWGVVTSMDMPSSELLLANLKSRKKSANLDEVLQKGQAPRFVITHVQNGLGNRLRAMASGLAFAAETGREPIVVWERDMHLGAYYSDVFNVSTTKFAVLNIFKPKWPLAQNVKFDSAWARIDYYNYMLPEGVGKYVVEDQSRNIYFKSSAIMNTSLTTWESENEQLRSLTVREEITRMAAKVYGRGMANVGGVQIRNRSLEEDIMGVKDNRKLYSKEDAALIDKWRATTKVGNFVGAMRDMVKNGTVSKFFVASDTVAVCEKLQRILPEGKSMYIPRDCEDREARCAKFAMADLLVLARVKVLLGSTWSSFTEAAMRLGGPKALLAGTDFGASPKELEARKPKLREPEPRESKVPS